MKILFEDKEYDFDLESLKLDEARTVKRRFQLTIRGLMDGLSEMDPDACAALYWLMLKQNGTLVDPDKMENFPILKFGEAFAEAGAKENPEDEEADPTTEVPEAAPNPT
jgi:hypothetical protein